MKAISTFLIILVIIAGVFFFTKPSEAVCLAAAKEDINAQRLSKTPGYENPMYDDVNGTVPSQAILIKDRVLWKQVDYNAKGIITTVGYGYLGAYHAAKGKKDVDKE
jgi:hypothetical protein